MQEFSHDRRPGCGSFIVDGSETILGFDEDMEALTGWPAIDVVGHPKQLSLGARLSEPTTAALKTIPLYEGELPTTAVPGNLELILHCRDGRSLAVEVLGQPLNGPGDRMLVTVIRVLASSTTRQQRPALVGRDPWTGLLDANAFYSRLAASHQSASAGARPLSLILIDIDRLRTVNDRWGWSKGDEVLQNLAGILRSEVEEGHIARLGDDEFAVLLEEGSQSEARRVAGAIRAKVERFRFFPEQEPTLGPQVTVSLGTATSPADADNERELIDRAHEALNDARAMGRNRVWCYLRRPRVPVQVPVYFDNADPALLGYMRDLSPSGFFMQTTAGIDVGMRCALAFPLPGHEGQVHVVGRVVRTVSPEINQTGGQVRVPGVGLEFERFGGAADRRAVDSYLHEHESTPTHPEPGPLTIE